mgnify:CR=1 FL=1|tara:strand:- start:753 stop:1805 length:1053 start_codon:yes stop_codon:yes gene_type:complete
MTREELKYVDQHAVAPTAGASVDHVKHTGPRVLRGAAARAFYPKLHWEKSASRAPPVDVWAYPLDVVLVEKVEGAPAKFYVDDPAYQRAVQRYLTLDAACVVCYASGSIVAVFVTARTMPSLARVAVQARAALDGARCDLKARETFVGGDYDRGERKQAENVKRHMVGTIWNEGLQTYNGLIWGKAFTQYTRRAPASSPAAFSLPFVGMYAAERAVVPAIADVRLKLLKEARLPCAFKGMPCAWMPATQVGISEDFAVTTHADSCVAGVTESIFWANRNVPNARFAVTSCEVAFDIGKQPCLLFMKGNEMHGTVPGASGSCGLVLISKRNTLQRYDKGGYTDLTNVRPGA